LLTVKAIGCLWLSRSLNLEVVAEGAGLQENIDFLQDNGCNCIQGFFYSKPLAAKDFGNEFKKMDA
jgi:EAL domain-containing protein (putative c-di-GMP-specific phosphodiesterase class I)